MDSLGKLGPERREEHIDNEEGGQDDLRLLDVNIVVACNVGCDAARHVLRPESLNRHGTCQLDAPALK